MLVRFESIYGFRETDKRALFDVMNATFMCVHVRACMSVSACMSVRAFTCVRECACAYVYAFVCVRLRACKYVRVSTTVCP